MMDLQNDRFKRITLVLFSVAVFLIFWQVSTHYYGPAYLSDEIGYLSKAAALSGNPVDIASSWHGGYSVILSPLFAFLSDPYQVWQGIMLLNALIFSCSFLILFYLMKGFFPNERFKDIFLSVCIASLYPCWITMSGYSFSTPLFVLVFLIVVYMLLKGSILRVPNVLFYSFLVGFLYWIHPTGMIVVIGSFLVFSYLAFYFRKRSLIILHGLILFAMICTYKFGIHEWLDQIMTPQGYDARSHYQTISALFECMKTLKFWKKWIIFVLGHSSYLLISTLGLILFPFVETVKRIRKHLDGHNNNDQIFIDTSLIFIQFSIVGIIFLGALSFSMSPANQLTVDHWVYGRYSEVVLLPSLAVGFLLCHRSLTISGGGAILVALSGIFLHKTTVNIQGELIRSVNQVNIPAFWPQYFFSKPSILHWFLLGTLLILLANFLKKRFLGILLILLFLTCAFNQKVWHDSILSYYSKPTDILKIVQDTFAEGECIGFDPFIPKGSDLYTRERYNLYSYYFFNYGYRRMTPEEWITKCQGPYFTYRPQVFEETNNTVVLAKEIHSGLCMVVKDYIWDKLDLEFDSSENILINLSGDSARIIKGCFDMSASELLKFSQVGQNIRGQLVADGKPGYLFYGPYRPLKQGHYFIILNCRIIDPEGAVFDIVSGKGKINHMNIRLADFSASDTGLKNIIRIPFHVDHDVKDIEVRLFLDSLTRLEFEDYSIQINAER